MKVAVFVVLALASCSSGIMLPQAKPMEPVPTASGPPPPLPDDPSTQIDKLHADLLARRSALSLPTPKQRPEQPCAPVCEVEDPPDKPTHTAGCGSSCATACVQADAACDDAAKICALAKQLQTSAGAADRCHDASGTCAAAQAPCCECKSPRIRGTPTRRPRVHRAMAPK